MVFLAAKNAKEREEKQKNRRTKKQKSKTEIFSFLLFLTS